MPSAGRARSLSAYTDRPIRCAWIQYQPEPAAIKPAALAGVLGAPHSLAFLSLVGATREVWGRLPVAVSADGHGLTADLVPRTSGTYSLAFEDNSQLVGSRLFGVRVFPDPAPRVCFEHPSRTADRLDFLAGAEIPVSIAAEDVVYGIRSVRLECCIRGEPSRHVLMLYGPETDAESKAWSSGSPDRSASDSYFGLSGKTRLGLQAKLSLSGITHSDGSALRDGDSVVVQAVADDFDDVTLDKQPGRSEEVEVHIVSPSTMAAILNEFQVRLRNEFLDLRKLQQDAIRNVQSVDQPPQNGGSAQERAVDTLANALALQQQIRSRIDDPKAGVRSEISRILRSSVADTPTHAASDRLLRQIVGELERVGGAALEKAETAIARALQERHGQETASSQKPNAALSQAVTHQREIERMIDDSLRALEPWAKVHEVQAEARQLAGDQQHLFDETQSLEKRIPRGESWEGLDSEQQGNLNQAAGRQTSLADRAAELLGKLDRLAQLGKARDASLSGKLAEGAAEGRRSGVAGLMNQSAQRIRENHLQQSQLLQREATQQLEQIAQKLSEGGGERPDRLRKKLRDLSASRTVDCAARQAGEKTR